MPTVTTPLRVVIADDEPLARQALQRHLAGRDDVTILALCATPKETIETCLRLRPDTILLDVQMGQSSGFDVLAAFPPDYAPTVIFVTAFERYAVGAFEARALDYVLKPVTPDRIEAAIARAKTQRNERQLALIAASPETTGDDRYLREIIVRVGQRQFPVAVEDIDWIEADSYYAKLHVGARSHLVRIPLHSLEERLLPDRFIRVHRSAIVNLARVRELRSDKRGHLIVVGQTEIAVSRGRWSAFVSAFRQRRVAANLTSR